MSERMITHYVGDQCPGGHEDREIIRFSVPLPPPELRSNSRKHWYLRKAAKEAYSVLVEEASQRAAYTWIADHRDPGTMQSRLGCPWEAAEVTYTWRYCGTQPDQSNLGQNLKALQDFLCVAPNTGLQKNDCTYLGIVKDDKNIEPHYELERVNTRNEQEVQIVIERRR